MTLFHGSPIGGITVLTPAQSNHDRPYVYLTHSEALATIYAHNPLTRPNGWFTYYWSRGGLLNYDEYFPDALAVLYRGHSGYVYTCEAEAAPMEKMPWIYPSPDPVPVSGCRFIPDLLEELLSLEQAGLLQINRYEAMSDETRANRRRIVAREVETCRLREGQDPEYARFIHTYFPDLL